ncbi:MAG: biotin--[acetyl-CoA-carboxylase] ligase [Bacteroidaceae bacterium]|nr:biotin--[acetyl-CoA-carboxylase] ligase [Bacteroidaceae bacterium]
MADIHFCLDDSPWFRMVELDEVTSTNDFLRSYRPVGGERRLTLLTAEHQTAGRGAGTNHWESVRGKNLLFSILVHPRHLLPNHIFVLSELLALAVRQALEDFLQMERKNMQRPDEECNNACLKIKWPNDIYYGDRKICGMLIENELQGQQIERSVMGVGINVNQTGFHSDAPTPISLAQILGHEVEKRFVLEKVVENFVHLYDRTEQKEIEELHQLYLRHLYRMGELHPFRDADGPFRGTIIDVAPTGHLELVDETGVKRRYAFKEVEYVI